MTVGVVQDGQIFAFAGDGIPAGLEPASLRAAVVGVVIFLFAFHISLLKQKSLL